MGVIPLILGVAIDNILNYSVIVFLTAIVIILLYLLLGLVAKSQVAAQVISLPVTLLVAFLPMMTGLDKSVAKVADYSFMGLFINFLTKWEDFSWVKSLIPSLSLAVWIILLVFCNFLVIKKRNTV